MMMMMMMMMMMGMPVASVVLLTRITMMPIKKERPFRSVGVTLLYVSI